MRPLRHGTVEVSSRAEWLRAGAAHALLVRAAAGAVAPFAPRLGSARLRRAERAWAAAVRRALRIDLRVEGLDHVDPGETYVVAALHESALDPLVVARLPLPLRWVLRREIVDEWDDVGPYLRTAGHVVIVPELPRRAAAAVVQGAEDTFASGESLAIFPQGTLLGVETAFLPGAAAVAARCGRPLLPVVVAGSHRVWEHPFGRKLRFGVPVGLRVLPPVPPDRVRAEWRSVERAMKAVALGPGTPPPRRFDPDRDGWWPEYRYEIDPAYPELAARAAAMRSSAMRR